MSRGKNASDLFPAVVKNVACKNIEVSLHSRKMHLSMGMCIIQSGYCYVAPFTTLSPRGTWQEFVAIHYYTIHTNGTCNRKKEWEPEDNGREEPKTQSKEEKKPSGGPTCPRHTNKQRKLGCFNKSWGHGQIHQGVWGEGGSEQVWVS